MAPINLKFKMADPELVTNLMTKPVMESLAGLGQPDCVTIDIVRSISLALTEAGCVVIQIDNEATP